MPRPIRLLAAGLAAYWVALAAGVGGAWVTQGAYLLLIAVPTALVAWRAVRDPHNRLAWGVLAAGLAVWAVGCAHDVRLAPLGSWDSSDVTDALWLGLYPCALVAVGLLAHAKVRRPPPALGLDALLIALVLAAVVTAVLLPAVGQQPGAMTFRRFADLTYPIVDGVLIAGTLVVALIAGFRAGRAWILLGVGATALAVADVMWAIDATGGMWPALNAYALYPLWPVLVAWAAWLPGPRGRVRVGPGEVRILAGASVAVLAALALLTAGHWVPLPAVTVVLAALGALAAVSRTVLALAASLRATRASARAHGVAEDVRDALGRGELAVHFQPLVHAESGDVCGAEALVRWPRPDGTITPPDDFLPAVERRADVLAELTDFVLGRALEALTGWRAAGHPIGVSVNLAAGNLSDPGLPGRVSEALALHGVPADALTLEITETAALEDDAMADRVLTGLDAVGVELSIDDFGTGHSSLARIARFPIDEVKIDRSFVTDLGSAKRPIVATTIRLAHTLGLRVVAEGIEDAGTLNALRGLGCDVAQGYFFSRPLPPAGFVRWLDDPARDPATAIPGGDAEALLRWLVEETGLEAAFVAQLGESAKTIEAFAGPETFGPLRAGARLPRHESYCDRVVRGVFPHVIDDAAGDERTRGLAITADAGLGAYVGVPLHDAEGELYGTLCCIGHEARPGLGDAELRTLRRAAETLRPLLSDAHLTLARRADDPARAA